jgi:hypothetical protein
MGSADRNKRFVSLRMWLNLGWSTQGSVREEQRLVIRLTHVIGSRPTLRFPGCLNGEASGFVPLPPIFEA